MKAQNQCYDIGRLTRDVEATLNERPMGRDPDFYQLSALAKVGLFEEGLDDSARKELKPELETLKLSIRRRFK